MTATKTVTFSIDDVELLYSVPRPGGDVSTILRAFVFLNRAATPPFSLFQTCFTKALQSGILVESNCSYQMSKEWYQRIHAHDESAGNEIESMLEFQDEFVGVEVVVVRDVQANIDQQQYEQFARELQ